MNQKKIHNAYSSDIKIIAGQYYKWLYGNKFEKNSMECTKPLKDTSYQNLLSLKFTINSVISNKENLNPWWFHWWTVQHI